MINVKPELPGGFKDYPPEDQIRRERAIGIIKRTFERFGFLPMDTPAVERLEVLTAGEPDFNKQIFKVSQISGENNESDLALRFDLTVPLARFIAANPEIKKPFKRYQIGRTWRGERQQAGRYKEFLQCDADIVGAPSVMADAEIVALMYETMRALGVSDFEIKISNIEVEKEFYDRFGSDTNKILIEIDKTSKREWSDTAETLKVIGLDEIQIKESKEFINMNLNEAEKKTPDSKGIAELKKLFSYLNVLGVPKGAYREDFSIVRGLGYYTGPVFETVLTKKPEVGSVFSGGRYDNLIEKFSGSKIPATGASLGFDRLFSVLGEVSSLDVRNDSVLILNFDENCEEAVLNTAKRLREAGISTGIYLGQESNLKGQLSYAVSREVPVVIIIGPEEKERGVVQVKDMRNRNQKEADKNNLVKKVNEIFKSQNDS